MMRIYRAGVRPRLLSVACASTALLAGCLATAPKLGEDKGTVTGAAGGAATDNRNSALAKCDETLGTLTPQEDVAAPWYVELRSHQLGSTLPVLRLMVQQSNCFVVVERGRGMDNMNQERSLQASGEMRGGSSFGKGQVVAADYTLSPSIQFSAKTAGGMGGLGGVFGAVAGVMAASVSKNEASTTLLLIDNRSSVQISAAEGTASNMDFGFLGGAFLGGLAGGASGYANTPQGKVIVAAFADSYNQMIKALRNYKAQTVRGGLGAGGRLGVEGGRTPASRDATAAPAQVVAPAVPSPKPAAKAATPRPAAKAASAAAR